MPCKEKMQKGREALGRAMQGQWILINCRDGERWVRGEGSDDSSSSSSRSRDKLSKGQETRSGVLLYGGGGGKLACKSSRKAAVESAGEEKQEEGAKQQ